ncbi:major histocompatibility complex class I-related gene protein-like [Cyprinodon tularosa]|uniref:major histocompatibility complex class I-related gene protein-like n=1 Tax=Cyprinodon tularosa TaxID=77115 RepID=UPI0018E21D8E|nr:major histocompatibility complex class I-related gene protein-like [Cyprinodon tularosa]
MLSSGIPNIPEYVLYGSIDEVVVVYYNAKLEMIEPRQDWVREIKEKNAEHWDGSSQQLVQYLPVFKKEATSLKQHPNQTEGDIVQQIMGCKWDDQTHKVEGYQTYSLNGEAFIRLDIETGRWVALCPQAEFAEKEWNKNPDHGQTIKTVFTTVCIDWLKIYDNYGKKFLHRKVLPSVSLLQKTPSSPVSCHATGFYPDKAVIFWRKDEDELYEEEVDLGEILPNCDGTFQISATLKNSAILPEDWDRYDCVFQLFSEENEIITKLDKMVIRTNIGKSTKDPPILIVLVAAAAVILIVGFIIYRKRKEKHTEQSSPDSVHELSERLSPA